MTALYAIVALALLVVGLVASAYTGWAITDEARRPDVQGMVTFRLLLVAVTAVVLAAEGLIGGDWFVAALATWAAQRFVLAPLDWPAPSSHLPRRTKTP